jgi:polysaccharide biosynthesis PFTS motif protein
MKGLSDQHFKLHMVWYSQNFIPKVYSGERERSSLPSARHMRIDVHWVWTEGFKSYLRNELNQIYSDIHVVGPILWYLPERVDALGSAEIKIAVFDVTPLPDGSTGFGAMKNYYSTLTTKKFITDIVSLCEEMERKHEKRFKILLKHKRMPISRRHDSNYLDFLEQIELTNPNFVIIDEQTNLFGLLEQCKLSISIPYTSTCYVAADMKRHAIYYDPFSELEPHFESSPYVHFAAGKSELMYKLQECLNDRDVLVSLK